MRDIRIAGIVNDSIVDGPGLRYTIFFQGCSHHCKGCQNPQTWDFRGGKRVKIDTILQEICDNPLLTGVTLSGGDPFDSPEDALVLVTAIKDKFPNLDIWAYTGYKYKELLKIKENSFYKASWQRKMLLEQIDVLVDGRYIAARRDLSLRFRGSSNQRILDVQASLKAGRMILWKEDQEEVA
jgi:anaerobic ribonucleoside-triphosphate reductase activating protein